MGNTQNDPRILRGMAAQLRLRQERLSAGQQSIGWKVGFGTSAAMERLGIDAPLVGFLTDAVRLPSGATISLADWVKPAAEPEIAVYMGADLLAAADRATTQAAIAAIGPAIELVDLNPPPDDVEAILSGNIYNRHVILGRQDTTRAGCVLDGLVGHVYRNGNEVATSTDPQALIGDLIDIVAHVAGLLAAVGAQLRAGAVIITGSIVPALWLEPGEEVRFALEPIDTVSIMLR